LIAIAMAERTRVYITVDIEGAEERPRGAGGLQPALGYDLRIWGRLTNQRRELGIGLIMDELEACGLRGTFFTEVFGAAFFGEQGLREICDALRGRGHDVQLHAHPAQRTPRWRSEGRAEPPDDMHAFSRDDQARLLREGLAILGRCGVPAAELRAFRAGNYGASNETWDAMRDAGLRLSSSYNPSYLGRSCRMQWPRAEPALFDTGHGVWELPISNFRLPRGGLRHLQITAVSREEVIDYLEQARALDIPEVTLVTHSFEYFWVDSIRDRRGRPNPINAARLRGVCRWLAAHARDFEVETVGALARRLPAPALPSPSAARGPAPAPRLPTGSLLWGAKRLAEQAIKRLGARRAEVATRS
jgi:hypothetical protein